MTEKYEPRRIDPEEIMRRADCSYLTEDAWESIVSQYDGRIPQTKVELTHVGPSLDLKLYEVSGPKA